MSREVVVVGGGLGGLSAAVALAEAGVPVVLLEKEPRLGGYAISYQRRDHSFDLALHAVAAGAPGQELHNLLSTLGVERDVRPVRLGQGFRVWLGERCYRLPNRWHELFAYLEAEFPRERDSLLRFRIEVEGYARAYAPLFDPAVSRWRAIPPFLPKIPAFLRQGSMPTKRYLDGFFGDASLKALLYHAAIFMGIPSGEFPTVNFLLMTHFLFDLGMYTLSGGGQGLTDALARRLRGLGGRVVTRARVREVIVSGRTAVGVRTEDDTEYLAHAVVAAVNLPHLVEELLGAVKLPVGYVEKVRALRPSLSVMVLSLGLDCHPRELGLDNHISVAFPNADVDGCLERQRRGIDPEGFSLTAHCNSEPGPEPGSWVVSAVAGTDAEPWLSMQERDYFEAKERAIRVLLERIDRIHPGFSSHVRVRDLSTPRTMHRYTGNPSGAIMGFAPTCGGHRDLLAAARIPVKRLHLAGAWTDRLGGFMQCLRSGVTAAEKVMKESGQQVWR